MQLWYHYEAIFSLGRHILCVPIQDPQIVVRLEMCTFEACHVISQLKHSRCTHIIIIIIIPIHQRNISRRSGVCDLWSMDMSVNKAW